MKKLLDSIYQITKNEKESESRNLEKAFKVFVNFSLSQLLLVYMRKTGSSQERFLITKDVISSDISNFSCDSKVLLNALSEYMKVVVSEEPFTDTLSETYEELFLTGRRGERLGQFMTPPDLSRAVSKLMLDDSAVSAIEKPIWFSEPCCGTGSMALATLHRIWSLNPEKLGLVNLLLNDIDETMVRVALLQVLSSVVLHNLDLNEVRSFNANLITEYFSDNTHFISFRKPVENRFMNESISRQIFAMA
ncbi:N-6 DNA methylase [Pseudomonas aeruginosa]|uniref:N-6 DNA methylase n=1 Tax=Pseudomonas aeruginosa TaxID=287 RepID=UPI00104EF0C1|nr:N-6 DNA methylase [Pseudomonas aeruginosa]